MNNFTLSCLGGVVIGMFSWGFEDPILAMGFTIILAIAWATIGVPWILRKKRGNPS